MRNSGLAKCTTGSEVAERAYVVTSMPPAMNPETTNPAAAGFGSSSPTLARVAAAQRACPGTVSPRNEHPRVSITAINATRPTAHAAIM